MKALDAAADAKVAKKAGNKKHAAAPTRQSKRALDAEPVEVAEQVPPAKRTRLTTASVTTGAVAVSGKKKTRSAAAMQPEVKEQEPSAHEAAPSPHMEPSSRPARGRGRPKGSVKATSTARGKKLDAAPGENAAGTAQLSGAASKVEPQCNEPSQPAAASRPSSCTKRPMSPALKQLASVILASSPQKHPQQLLPTSPLRAVPPTAPAMALPVAAFDPGLPEHVAAVRNILAISGSRQMRAEAAPLGRQPQFLQLNALLTECRQTNVGRCEFKHTTCNFKDLYNECTTLFCKHTALHVVSPNEG